LIPLPYRRTLAAGMSFLTPVWWFIKYRAARNLLASIGPFLISQWQPLSDRWKKHKDRMTVADAGKQLITLEVETYAAIRRTLLAKLALASPEERFDIRKRLQDLDAETRCLEIVRNAFDAVPECNSTLSLPAADTSTSAAADEPPPIPHPIDPHWYDEFSSLARRHNEPWRAALLSKMLAKEACEPGTISARLLWLVGTMEERTFEVFAAVLSVSAKLGEDTPFIAEPTNLNDKTHDFTIGGKVRSYTLGALRFLLGDTGLLGSSDSFRIFSPKTLYTCIYGPEKITFVCSTQQNVHGVLVTELGRSLSTLCLPSPPHPLGIALFERWKGTVSGPPYQLLHSTANTPSHP
jgi:hypothetical protein